MKVAYGDDDDQKSFQETQGLIQAYPNLKGIISPTTVGVAAAARYLSTSPQKGKIKLTGLGFPNQMRKFVKDGTVEEFQLWVPEGRRLPRRPGRRGARLRAHHRQGGREVQGRAARRVHDRQERRDRARPADDVQQGQHRRLRLLESDDRHGHPRAAARIRPGHAPGSASSDRPGAYWPQFDGPQGAHRGLPAPRRGARRELGGEVVSAGLVDTAQKAPRGGRPLRGRAGRPRALPRGHLRDVEHGAAGRCRPRRCRSCCSGCSRRRRSTTRTRTRASGWPTARPAACRRSRARSRARGSPTTPSRARSTTTSARGGRSPPGCARRAWPARCAARGIGFMGHTYPGMLDMYSDFTAVHAQLGAHVEVLEIDDLGSRVAARDRRARSRPRRREIREMFAFADPSDDPIAGPIEDEQLDWSARVAVGLDRLADDFELDGLTYYYRGVDGNEAERLGAGVIVGNSLLTARGVPTSGEGDLKTNIAQLMLDRLGAGGSYTEYYALDFDEDFVLMGHDGPGHIAIAAGAADAARAQALPRQARRRAERRVQGPLRAGHDRRLHPDRRRAPEADRRRGRVDPRRDVPDRQHQQPPAVRARPAEFFERWCAQGPTHHVALGVGHVAARGARASRRCSTSSTRRWADGARLLPAARPPGAARRVQGAPPRRCGRRCSTRCARRAGATTRCSCATTGC